VRHRQAERGQPLRRRRRPTRHVAATRRSHHELRLGAQDEHRQALGHRWRQRARQLQEELGVARHDEERREQPALGRAPAREPRAARRRPAMSLVSCACRKLRASSPVHDSTPRLGSRVAAWVTLVSIVE
jgi:hypothetical protein